MSALFTAVTIYGVAYALYGKVRARVRVRVLGRVRIP